MRWAAFLLAAALPVAGCAGDARVEEAKRLVEAELRDPRSAQWEDLRSGTAPTGDAAFPRLTSGGRIVCGRVNGRNAFGAYAGFQRFIVDLSAGRVIMEPDAGRSLADIERAAAMYEGVTFDLLYSTACPAPR